MKEQEQGQGAADNATAGTPAIPRGIAAPTEERLARALSEFESAMADMLAWRERLAAMLAETGVATPATTGRAGQPPAGRGAGASDAEFVGWWRSDYRHHQARSSRKEAWRLWQSVRRSGVSAETIRAVTRYIVATDDRWQRAGGDFIPAAERFLRQVDFGDPDLVKQAMDFVEGSSERDEQDAAPAGDRKRRRRRVASRVA
jgi:hypothetical protein